MTRETKRVLKRGEEAKISNASSQRRQNSWERRLDAHHEMPPEVGRRLHGASDDGLAVVALGLAVAHSATRRRCGEVVKHARFSGHFLYFFRLFSFCFVSKHTQHTQLADSPLPPLSDQRLRV